MLLLFLKKLIQEMIQPALILSRKNFQSYTGNVEKLTQGRLRSNPMIQIPSLHSRVKCNIFQNVLQQHVQCCQLLQPAKSKKEEYTLRRKDESNFNGFINMQDNCGKMI